MALPARATSARLLDGRLIDERDAAGAPLAVVINQTMKRRYWPDGSPIGRQMRFGSRNTPLFTIVGIVQDIKERGYELAMKPAIYLSFAQTPTTWALPEFLAVRVSGNPTDTVDALRRIVAAADPDQPVAAVRTMDEILELDVADRHQQMMLLGAFAGSRCCWPRWVCMACCRTWCCSAAASSVCGWRSARPPARWYGSS